MNERLFCFLCGVDESALADVLIITPCLTFNDFAAMITPAASRFSGNTYKGFTEASGATPFSVIKSPQGPTFIGDLLLCLQRTDYRAIIFIGYAGTVGNLAIGSLNVISRAYEGVGFSRAVKDSAIDIKSCPSYVPDQILFNKAVSVFPGASNDSLYSTSSFVLEFQRPEYIESLRQQSITLVDFEGSAFYAAAACKLLPAIAFTLVTDIIATASILDQTESYRGKIKSEQQRFLSRLFNTFIPGLNNQ